MTSPDDDKARAYLADTQGQEVLDDGSPVDDGLIPTRCWVTLRIAVDIEHEGERPTDEDVHEALNLTLSDYMLDRDHITWGVEGIDKED